MEGNRENLEADRRRESAQVGLYQGGCLLQQVTQPLPLGWKIFPPLKAAGEREVPEHQDVGCAVDPQGTNCQAAVDSMIPDTRWSQFITRCSTCDGPLVR